jgi:hypothetical protein
MAAYFDAAVPLQSCCQVSEASAYAVNNVVVLLAALVSRQCRLYLFSLLEIVHQAAAEAPTGASFVLY